MPFDFLPILSSQLKKNGAYNLVGIPIPTTPFHQPPASPPTTNYNQLTQPLILVKLPLSYGFALLPFLKVNTELKDIRKQFGLR